MNAQTLAKDLNAVEYGFEVSPEIRKLAKDNRLVIVYGSSDDLLEFDGTIYEELYAYEGCECYINKCGELSDNSRNGERSIKAIFNPPLLNASWEIKTDIPCFHFDVMEDGVLFCRGLVFSLDDI